MTRALRSQIIWHALLATAPVAAQEKLDERLPEIVVTAQKIAESLNALVQEQRQAANDAVVAAPVAGKKAAAK